MPDRLFQTVIAAIVAVAVIACGLFLWHARAPKPAPTPTPVAATPPPAQTAPHTADLKVAVGREGALRNGSETVDVAVNQAALLSLAQAADKRSLSKYNAVFTRKRAFRVGDGTRVRILGEGTFSGHIEVLNGASTGRTGYVPQEWIAAQ
ncbi:MAG TPA: hypothetical protein VGK19_19590 [Capsulimonadaceae bacterium]|jgi:hypothetical protein